MSDSENPWWPGSDNPDPTTWFERPAFTNKRDIGGVITGGDYVRGSTVEGLHRAALKYPTSSEAEKLVPGKGVFYVRPYDYSTVEIQWNIPPEVLEVWDEVSIVRSAFGHPSTVNDGQTIFRQTKTELFPQGYQRDEDGKAVGVATERVYDPRDPTKSSDPGLYGGRWYYYALFFRIDRNWVRSIVANTLLPRDHHHSDHLWNALPPYYRWMDEQQMMHAGEGDLRKYLRIFGFELDLEREYVESWQNLYNTDFCPGPLLRRLGHNFGLDYESGIGDIRYRSLMSRIGYFYRQRGTQECLRKVIEAVCKCQCDISTSENTMLLADDTDFFQGTGHWAGLHPSTPAAQVLRTPADLNPTYNVLNPSQVYLASGVVYTTPVSGSIAPPVGGGRGVMRFWTLAANATTDAILACGDGIAYDRYDEMNKALIPPNTRTFIPRYAGIPVEPDNVYGFSISVKPPNTSVTFDAVLAWFDKVGNHSSLTGFSSRGGMGAFPNTNWNVLTTQGTAPHAIVATGSGLAKIEATPDPTTGLRWTFRAKDWPGGSASQTGYNWSFGSGTPATATNDAEVTVQWATAGNYNVVLTPPTGTPGTISVPTIAAPTMEAFYCVPMIYIKTRPTAVGSYSPLIYFGGASFTLFGSAKVVSAEAPDRYLTLGVIDEKLGIPTEAPPFPGYLIGEPQ